MHRERGEVVAYEAPAQPGTTGSTAVLDNRTGLPDSAVSQAVLDAWTEVAGLQFGAPPSNFQLYAANQGSMLARTPFRTPGSVIDEIKLARAVADTDDDIAAVMGGMIALATRGGFKHLHEDEKTLGFFNEFAKGKNMGLLRVFKELYREYLISGQVISLSLFMRQRLQWYPTGSKDAQSAQLSSPRVGIIPAEDVRVTSNDIFGDGQLAYLPPDRALKEWLEEFFNPRTTAAKKAQMARDNPVLAAVFTGQVQVPWNDQDMFSAGQVLYTLNPRMVHRTTMPKGASAYPRPLLTRNFALLEAKRLLNIMDYALLQGGTNYIVVAKKGTDQQPASQPEVDNLVDQVRTASRSGVLVGDHRLSIEIITPDLTELLNPNKRKLLGRKLAMALLRIPEQVTGDPGQAGAAQEQEQTAAVIMGDREDLIAHIEDNVYEEAANRNRSTFAFGSPNLWAPQLILGSNKDFWASVVQARDRGDIPRRWAVETLGFDYDAGVAERKREIERGDDEVLTPGSVPFSEGPGGPGGQGGDNGGGRPPGSGGNGRGANQPASPDPAQRQRRRLSAVGESIVASWDADSGATVRVGELTAAVLEEYVGFEVGRITNLERQSVDAGVIFQQGPIAVIPVNPEYAVEELRVLRLDEGLSMVVGQRTVDRAMVAKALCFREPAWDVTRAEDTALRWGFTLPPRAEDPEEEHAAARRPRRCRNCGNELPSYSSMNPTCPSCGADNSGGGDTMAEMVTAMANAMAQAMQGMPVPNITIQMPQANGTVKTVKRDEDPDSPTFGQIIAVEEVPAGGGG